MKANSITQIFEATEDQTYIEPNKDTEVQADIINIQRPKQEKKPVKVSANLISPINTTQSTEKSQEDKKREEEYHKNKIEDMMNEQIDKELSFNTENFEKMDRLLSTESSVFDIQKPVTSLDGITTSEFFEKVEDTSNELEILEVSKPTEEEYSSLHEQVSQNDEPILIEEINNTLTKKEQMQIEEPVELIEDDEEPITTEESTPTFNTVENTTKKETKIEPLEEELPKVNLNTKVSYNVEELKEKEVKILPSEDTTIDKELELALEDFTPMEEEEESIVEENILEGIYVFNLNDDKPKTPASKFIVPLFSEEEGNKIIDGFETVLENKNTKEYQNLVSALNDNTSVEHKTYIGASAYFSESQNESVDRLKYKVDTYPDNTIANGCTLNGVKYNDPKASKGYISSLNDGTIITGKDQSAIAIAALISGIRRIHLYNSGFWIEVKAVDPAENINYQIKSDIQTEEYGRMLGGSLYSYQDLSIKKASMELIKSCILKSNLENFRIDDVFERNLSILDYETCLWGIGTLLFPDGIDVSYTCYNEKCQHVDSVTVNPVHMRITDFTSVGQAGLLFTHSEEKRSEKDITEYKKNVLNERKTYFIDNNKTWAVNLSIPTVSDVFKHGTEFISKMTESVHINNITNASVYETANRYKNLLPYIDNLCYVDGDKKVWIKDFHDNINSLSNEKNIVLDKEISNHIKRCTLSYFGYPYSACPKCGSKPDYLIHNILPADMGQTFFIMAEEKASAVLNLE